MMWRARVLMLAITIVTVALIAVQVRRRQMRTKYLVMWSLLAAGIIPLAVWPGLLERVSLWIGIYYAPTTVFLAASVVLVLLNIHFSREISRMEERTRILAEEIALLRAEMSQPAEPKDG
jgi:hypothetical protein